MYAPQETNKKDHSISSSQPHDTAEHNRKHFDLLAQGHGHDHAEMIGYWEAISRKVGAAILQAYNFKSDETAVLDFACGTGICSSETSERRIPLNPF